MKQLKSFNGFVRESSDEDQKELMGMGFGDKLQLEDPSEIMDAVTDHFNGDDEVMQLVQKLEARLTVLMEEFEQKFEYDENEMYAAAETYTEYERDSDPSIGGAIAMKAIWALT